jgi:hypothetical protein
VDASAKQEQSYAENAGVRYTGGNQSREHGTAGLQGNFDETTVGGSSNAYSADMDIGERV